MHAGSVGVTGLVSVRALLNQSTLQTTWCVAGESPFGNMRFHACNIREKQKVGFLSKSFLVQIYKPQVSPGSKKVGNSLLMSHSCRFPAGHVAVMDNTDLKEILILRLLHFQNLLFLFKKGNT